MKSRYVTPKLEHLNFAIVLSANDVVATVLVVMPDEQGYEPLYIAEVDLPNEARIFRQSNPEGKSWLQRGDIIQIDCKVTKQAPYEAKPTISDEAISDIWYDMRQFEDDNAELFWAIDIDQKRFAKDWIDLCKRDLEKRKEGRKGGDEK